MERLIFNDVAFSNPCTQRKVERNSQSDPTGLVYQRCIAHPLTSFTLDHSITGTYTNS
jgi:hypothetical protein